MGGASLVGRLVTGWLVDRFCAARVSFALRVLAAPGTFVLAGAIGRIPMGRAFDATGSYEVLPAEQGVIDRCGLVSSRAGDSFQVYGYRASFRWLGSTRSLACRRATLFRAPQPACLRGYHSES
jgi:hypothetical protein